MNNIKQVEIAIILAAGFGTRMQEMGRDTPKAMLPVAHITPLDITIQKLRKAGVKKIIINLHYLGTMIKEYIRQKKYRDIEIIFSEEKTILGTGGGIAFAEPYFNQETILVVNSDILSDLSFKEFMENHYKIHPLASMAVWPSQNIKEYALLVYDQDQRLVDILPKGRAINKSGTTGIFMGYHILTPQARKYLKPSFSSVIEDFYRPALRDNKKISVYPHRGTWIDIGSKEHYYNILERLERGELSIQQLL